jgi:hypothetical protein
MNTNRISSVIVAGTAALSLIWATPSFANSVAKGSIGSVVGSAFIIGGGLFILSTGTKLVVTSIQATAKGSVIVLTDTATGAQQSINLAAGSVKKGSVAVGTAVTAVASAAGVMLVASGKLLAFVPNEMGKRLSHSSSYAGQQIPVIAPKNQSFETTEIER